MDIMEKKIYTITLDNYHGESSTEHFFQLKNALARFMALMDEGMSKDEFTYRDDYFGFFDADYDGYSTCITMTEGLVKDLFSDEMI